MKLIHQLMHRFLCLVPAGRVQDHPIQHAGKRVQLRIGKPPECACIQRIKHGAHLREARMPFFKDVAAFLGALIAFEQAWEPADEADDEAAPEAPEA